ncbi:TetR/AcrR family transcriptional regulator [Herbiconiux sp. CPCC 205763]|uniref:TetR/AcrR family transcriptional regulator n=1 Tax=Herbiconiux aconitum TaxID=2970913 RepID=A0ABT2GMX4_9MICO|nr:TetR/AcrR family transcriptional regulator [Herbiconiux aconitum]MCS5717581.1 TetR/AcrR family transcriptional regulator [Herbiconiux aconitum]
MARPRAFDESQALRAALLAFWEYGYEETTLAVLMQATGLNKTSLYRTFGNKEELFERAVALYHRDFLGFRAEAMAAPSPKQITERLLRGMAALHNGDGTPPGCLETTAALATGPQNDPVRAMLSGNRNLIIPLLTERFEEFDADDLPPRMSAAQTASFVATVIMGMSVQAKGGHDRAEMDDVVTSTLRIWGD